jgi:hypothetical protein
MNDNCEPHIPAIAISIGHDTKANCAVCDHAARYRRGRIHSVLRRGIATRQLPPSTDEDLITNLLLRSLLLHPYRAESSGKRIGRLNADTHKAQPG